MKNKTVLVTGASRGIGLEIAKMFAAAGANVCMHYNRNEEQAKKELEKLNGHGHWLVQGDLSDIKVPEILINKVVAHYKRLDVVVNNAGIFTEHPPASTPYLQWDENWRRTLQVNLNSPVDISYFASRHMAEHGGGKIINITSRGAFRGEPDAPAYGASKAALNAFSQSMAKAMATRKVFFYAVAPGFVETDMATDILEGPLGESIRNQSPMGRVAKPEEVARTVLFLASEGTDFLTGGIIDVNGASYLRT